MKSLNNHKIPAYAVSILKQNSGETGVGVCSCINYAVL